VPSIPQIGAIKDFEPDPGNFLQHKFLEKALQSRHEALSWPRWSQAKTLVKGVWEFSRNQVNVAESHSICQFFGTSRPEGKGFCLQAEEALFLMESGLLQITTTCHQRRSVPWSLEDAYLAFMNHPTNPLCLNQYKVFGRLARAGYAVALHRKTNFTVYERMIGLDRFVTTNPPLNDDDDDNNNRDNDVDGDGEKERGDEVWEDQEREHGLDEEGMKLDSEIKTVAKTPMDADEVMKCSLRHDKDGNDEVRRDTAPEWASSNNWKIGGDRSIEEKDTHMTPFWGSSDDSFRDSILAPLPPPPKWTDMNGLHFPNLTFCARSGTYDHTDDNQLLTGDEFPSEEAQRRRHRSRDASINGNETNAALMMTPAHHSDCSGVAELGQLRSDYLPYAVTQEQASKMLRWTWNTSSTEKWIRDVKMADRFVKPKHRRKRKWLPWTPDPHPDRPARNTSGTTAMTTAANEELSMEAATTCATTTVDDTSSPTLSMNRRSILDGDDARWTTHFSVETDWRDIVVQILNTDSPICGPQTPLHPHPLPPHPLHHRQFLNWRNLIS